MLKIYSSVSQSHRGERIFRETIRKKFTKADVIKRIMREQKQCFGPLLETKKEKNQRIKRQNKNNISVTPPASPENNVDSELAWILRNTASRLRPINIKPGSNFPSASKGIISQNNLGAVAPDLESKTFRSRTVKITAPKAKEFSKPLTNVEFVSDKTTAAEVPPQATVPEKRFSLLQNRNPLRAENEPETVDLKSESEVESEVDTKDSRIENITRASLFPEKRRDCAEGWDSTILSISMMEDKESLQFPSVTKILNATMSTSAKKLLEMWEARMIRELGRDGFDAYKKELLANGKLFHSAVDNALRKIPVEVPATLRPCLDSVQTVVEEIKEVRAVESHVVHRKLRYHGVLDCVASYRGNLCLIDWKKSDKTKNVLSSTYDAPLQIASYIGALNSDENYPFQIKRGVIVVAYTTGHHPTVHELDQTKVQYYWEQWLGRLKQYYQMQSS